jgi:hypothetical protein
MVARHVSALLNINHLITVSASVTVSRSKTLSPNGKSETSRAHYRLPHHLIVDSTKMVLVPSRTNRGTVRGRKTDASIWAKG